MDSIMNEARKIKVLIIDDHYLTRDSLLTMLKLADDIEPVGTAEDGRDGLTLACELRPDVVLMDINLPKVDGITTSRNILRLLPQTYIILMSGEFPIDFNWHLVLPEAKAFLLKPFSTDELLGSIRQFRVRV